MTDPRSEIWDCVVVGAGVIGSWTACHLTQAGYNTLLIDQFALPHSRGSSHGQSRLIRKLYFHEHHVAIIEDCYDLWGKLATEVNRPLMRKTGLVIIADKNSRLLKQTIAASEKYPEVSEFLNETNLKRRFPMLRLPPGVNGVIDNTACLMPADTCLHALWEMIKKNGGTIQDSTQVKHFNPSTEPASIFTNKGIIKARRIILAPGPWASDLLHKVGLNLPLKTIPGYAVYSRDFTGEYSAEAKCPVVYEYIKDDDEGYRFCGMFPSLEYPGLVKMVSRGEPAPEYCHPDDRDKCSRDEVARIIKDYVNTHLPGVDPDPSIIEPAMYTMTPDKDFVIDQHPRYKNVFVGAGGSGHGFMRAPVIGKILCEMIQGKETYDRKAFRIDRFPSSKL